MVVDYLNKLHRRFYAKYQNGIISEKEWQDFTDFYSGVASLVKENSELKQNG